jgi:hypothetical protein
MKSRKESKNEINLNEWEIVETEKKKKKKIPKIPRSKPFLMNFYQNQIGNIQKVYIRIKF